MVIIMAAAMVAKAEVVAVLVFPVAAMMAAMIAG